MKLLVVEDDEKIRNFIAKGLQQSGYTVDTAENGLDGLHLGLESEYDAAIIDLMLPKLGGLNLIEQLRTREVNTPVIILSAKNTVDDRVSGLKAGGDDYLVKPFAFSELQARVEALIRRSGSIADTTQEIRFGDLVLDLIKREATRGEEKIHLNNKEFSLLRYFITNPGRLLSKTSILEKVYEYNFDPQTNVVDVLVCRLRNKVDKDFDKKLIHTVRGMGYILDDR